MSLAGAVSSVLDLLRRRLREREGDAVGEEWSFEVCDADSLASGAIQRVGLLVHRVEIDPGARSAAAPSAIHGAAPRALSVDLRLLLVVWGGDPLSELVVLGRCMEILDQHPVLTADDLDPAWPWLAGAALKLAPDALGAEQIFQIWQGCQTPHRLCVPYVLRGVRLARPDEALVPVRAAITAVQPGAVPR